MSVSLIFCLTHLSHVLPPLPLGKIRNGEGVGVHLMLFFFFAVFGTQLSPELSCLSSFGNLLVLHCTVLYSRSNKGPSKSNQQ